MQTVRDLVESSRVFEGLSESMLEQIAGCGTLGGVEEGEHVLRAGEEATIFHVIRSGRVAMEIAVPGRGPVMVGTRGPGDAIGWSWLFPPFRTHFDAVAMTPLRTINLDGACLRGKCEQDPALGYQLMRRFAQLAITDLEGTQMQMLDVYGNVATR